MCKPSTPPHQPQVHNRDPEEPAAHIAQAMDTLMAMENGAYAVEDMLLCASMALLRAQDVARRQGDDDASLRVNRLYDDVNNLLAS